MDTFWEFILLFAIIAPTATQWSRPCVGAHCQGQPHPPAQPRTGQAHPIYQQDARFGQHRARSAPLSPYAVHQPPNGGFTQRDGARKTNPRTITAEVFHPGCAGGTCPSTVSHHPATHDDDGNARDCKGFGCKLPSRMRQKQTPCLGEGCVDQAADPGRGNSSPVHVTDRAAQFLGELPDLTSDRGAWIQLTCDMKPGSNEVPSEDALVLQLQLSKSQERLVEALQDQQSEVKELQRLLAEQQGTLVSQQREILEQQRRMYEQMEQVKAQYNVLMDGIKQTSFQNLQGELDSHMEALSGQVRAHRTQQALSLHKVDVEASVMEVGGAPPGCGGCGPEEYCSYSGRGPRCERCTVCPPGFFLVAQCSVHADRICQDRDECLEIADMCGDQQKCLNTPGGFRCHGMTVREASSGMCGHGYFFNSDADECQACSECEGGGAAPCTFTADAVCSGPAGGGGGGEGALSLSWSGGLSLPGGAPPRAFSALQLRVRGDGDHGDQGPVSAEDGRLVVRQHGLLWLDGGLALSHGCRSFVQVCLRLNASDGGGEGRELSGVRVEQRERRSLQGASLSGVAEVSPGHALTLLLRSAGQPCNQSGEALQLYEPAAPALSLLWLSHDTGAVAMTAQAAVAAHYHTSYRPAFRTTSTSDPYVAALTHDGRGVRFAEAGAVRFVFQQALYSMGQACVGEGFHLAAYLSRNATAVELTRAFKPGVHYRDTSVSVAGAAAVEPGDTLGFEILAPAQCNVRFFADQSGGVSLLSLVWVPAAISSSLSAAVAGAGLPSGAVRNKPLFFRQTSPRVAQMGLLTATGAADQSRDFVFAQSGTVSVVLDLKLIHSCSLVKVTLHRRSTPQGPGGGGGGVGGQRPVPLAQQVDGQMPEGSQWASLSLRASFQVHNGTAVFFLLDCVRGRVNHISHETGSGVSVLWVAA